MSRITVRKVRDWFRMVFVEMDMKIETCLDVDGSYINEYFKLDYNPNYGGYRIDKVHTDTSESWFWPTGGTRVSGKEMIAFLKGLYEGFKITRGEN